MFGYLLWWGFFIYVVLCFSGGGGEWGENESVFDKVMGEESNVFYRVMRERKKKVMIWRWVRNESNV